MKTLRDYRLSMLIWSVSLAFLLAYYAWVYVDLFMKTNRAQVLAEYQQVFDKFSFLTGRAYDIDTYGGFITAEFMAYLPVLVGLFALLSGSALIRSEEERGSLDVLLAAPLSRTSVLLQKWAGLVVSLAVIVVFCYGGLLAGAAANNLGLEAGQAALACLNVFFLCLVYGTLALLLSQFVSRKVAASWTGGLLAAGFLMNTLGESISGLGWLRYFSPFYYYTLSKPMARSVGMNWGGFAEVVLLSVPLLVFALAFYIRRDHNQTVHLAIFGRKPLTGQRMKEPMVPWFGGRFLFELRRDLPSALVWGISLALYIAMIIPYLNEIHANMVELLKSDFYKMLGFGDLASNENLLSLVFFVFATALIAAYSVILVAGWTSDETEGRMELLLANPAPRWRWLFNRSLVALLSTGLAILICWLTFVVACGLSNVTIDNGKAAGAFFGMWVLSAVIIGAGFGLAGFIPDKAVPILSGLVVISYLVELLREFLKPPAWVADLSIFHQYGQPMLNGLNWTAQAIMLAVAAACWLAAGLGFWKRDILK
jgi:ABC-2 type transport system permease protein